MTKLSSRLNLEDAHLQRLRELIDIATDGVISDTGDAPPAATMDEAIDHCEITFSAMLDAIDGVQRDLDNLSRSHAQLSVMLAQREGLIEALTSSVDFDDALEHATIDFMDSLMASGAAEPSFDGEICFETGVALSASDLKPYIREAISTWLHEKTK